jgi:hypothetical protein
LLLFLKLLDAALFFRQIQMFGSLKTLSWVCGNVLKFFWLLSLSNSFCHGCLDLLLNTL